MFKVRVLVCVTAIVCFYSNNLVRYIFRACFLSVTKWWRKHTYTHLRNTHTSARSRFLFNVYPDYKRTASAESLFVLPLGHLEATFLLIGRRYYLIGPTACVCVCVSMYVWNHVWAERGVAIQSSSDMSWSLSWIIIIAKLTCECMCEMRLINFDLIFDHFEVQSSRSPTRVLRTNELIRDRSSRRNGFPA